MLRKLIVLIVCSLFFGGCTAMGNRFSGKAQIELDLVQPVVEVVELEPLVEPEVNDSGDNNDR